MIKAAIAFKKAVADIGFIKAIARIKFSDFLTSRFFADALGLSDLPSKGVGKGVSDTSFTADAAEFSIGKVQGDSGSLSDQIDTLGIGKLLQDSSSVAESIDIQTAFNRSHTDAFTAAESISLGAGKAFVDFSAFTDSEEMAFGKGLADSSAMTDSAVFSPSKIISDSSSAAEDQTMDFHKFVGEVTGVTDDLGGEATADDDQEMTFTKVRSDLATFADLFAYSSTSALSDTMGASDSGSMRGQGYCSFDYFAEDYVGYSKSF